MPRDSGESIFAARHQDVSQGPLGTKERALQNQFWTPQKVGLVWSVPVPSKENDRP